jgi:hypothetical protein
VPGEVGDRVGQLGGEVGPPLADTGRQLTLSVGEPPRRALGQQRGVQRIGNERPHLHGTTHRRRQRVGDLLGGQRRGAAQRQRPPVVSPGGDDRGHRGDVGDVDERGRPAVIGVDQRPALDQHTLAQQVLHEEAGTEDDVGDWRRA